MTNEQLVARIQAGEDTGENMAQLYDQVKDFIRSVAWQYRDTGEMEDLLQEGYLALYPAIDNYDPSAGVKFLTYASHWIHQRMRRYLQNNGSCMRIPVQCLEQIRKMKKFQSDYEKEYGREPSAVEIARFMWLTLEQVRALQENACMASLRSLDAPVVGADGTEDATVLNLVAAAGNQEEDVLDRMEKESLCRTLWGCVDSLPEIQAEVIRSRYQGKLTLRECGTCCGLTVAAARQQHDKALRSLRSGENGKLLRQFLPEDSWIYNSALIGGGVGHFAHTWTSSTERVALEL
jgi:RNA polymerase sigma factor (sigma-70 family)